MLVVVVKSSLGLRIALDQHIQTYHSVKGFATLCICKFPADFSNVRGCCLSTGLAPYHYLESNDSGFTVAILGATFTTVTTRRTIYI
jgi:hypothetical protein